MRGLESGWEATLRQEPEREPELSLALELADGTSWPQREFRRPALADKRLLERMGAAWERHPGAPLPGNKVLWRACVQLQMTVRGIPAARGP